MNEVQIDLTEEEYNILNTVFPRNMQSSKVGERAIELVKMYFKKKYPGCSFISPQRGADLRVRHDNGIEEMEIKGTEASDISYPKLKVSSNQSHALLTNGMPLYRIVSVYDRHPRIVIMTCPEDFEMIPEARWSVRPRKNVQ
jgi:hypothetical protein